MSNLTTTDDNKIMWDSSNYKKNVQKFSLNGLCMDCKCVKVYDGDTITVVGKSNQIYNGQELIYNLRIIGIDTPEVRSKKLKEKKLAIFVRDILKEMILNKMVQVEFGKFGKYGGRTLGNVWIGETNIAKHLLDRGYANPYDGGKKIPWFPNEPIEISDSREINFDVDSEVDSDVEYDSDY